jgi:hypothetical protein
MQAYKFDTIISDAGSILLPYAMPNLYGREVELFIVPKEKTRKKRLNQSKRSENMEEQFFFLFGKYPDFEDAETLRTKTWKRSSI